ncbi:hypothetical protein Tco_0897824 [Tanacetum coccineum]
MTARFLKFGSSTSTIIDSTSTTTHVKSNTNVLGGAFLKAMLKRCQALTGTVYVETEPPRWRHLETISMTPNDHNCCGNRPEDLLLRKEHSQGDHISITLLEKWTRPH